LWLADLARLEAIITPFLATDVSSSSIRSPTKASTKVVTVEEEAEN
jgi:hypothetical protein